MDRFLLVCIIIQLITTAFGLAVIESVRPLINRGLRDRGYILRNKNSLYNFSSTITDIAKGFIPFYYFSKALAIISNKDRISDLINDEINSGKYLTLEDVENKKKEEEGIGDLSIFKSARVEFEKPETYKARKIDYSMYNTYETPIEYITREVNEEEDLELSPYVKEEEKVAPIEKSEIINIVSKSDIAKAISELDLNELEKLQSKINELSEIKKEDLKLKLEKDVA